MSDSTGKAARARNKAYLTQLLSTKWELGQVWMPLCRPPATITVHISAKAGSHVSLVSSWSHQHIVGWVWLKLKLISNFNAVLNDAWWGDRNHVLKMHLILICFFKKKNLFFYSILSTEIGTKQIRLLWAVDLFTPTCHTIFDDMKGVTVIEFLKLFFFCFDLLELKKIWPCLVTSLYNGNSSWKTSRGAFPLGERGWLTWGTNEAGNMLSCLVSLALIWCHLCEPLMAL